MKPNGIGLLVIGLSNEVHCSFMSAAQELEDLRWIVRVLSFEGATEVSRLRAPDVVLVDIPEQETVQRQFSSFLANVSPRPGVVALTSGDMGAESLRRAILMGAAALIGEDMPPEFIISTIGRVFNGEQPIEHAVNTDSELGEQLLKSFREAAPSSYVATPSPLTDRALEVLFYVARGSSNKELASQLGVKEQTVKNAISAILRKLDASDRTHAVTIALRNRWITLD